MIRAKKSLGQNFLVDKRIAERIVDSVSPQLTDTIIEIGSGTGALTTLLAQRSGKAIAIELDRALAGDLAERVGAANLSVINQDVLAVDWNALTQTAAQASSTDGKQRVRVVANLPYYISTAIIELILPLPRPQLFDSTLMLQKEVVDRIVASPGNKQYGYLSVLVQFYAEATRLFDVPPSAFKPQPKVTSAVVRLVRRERPAVDVHDERRFFAVVQASFAHRRKTIANNLKAAARDREFCAAPELALLKASIEPLRRAETLSLAEFAKLDAALYSK